MCERPDTPFERRPVRRLSAPPPRSGVTLRGLSPREAETSAAEGNTIRLMTANKRASGASHSPRKRHGDHPENRLRERAEQRPSNRDCARPREGSDLHKRGKLSVVQAQPHAEASTAQTAS